MRKLLITLAVWLALAVPAIASTLPATYSIGAVTLLGTASVNTNAVATGPLLIMACNDANGASMTPVASGWTTLHSFTDGGIWSRTVGGSEPGAYTATGTVGNHIACTLIYVQNTDGSTPVIDASAFGATGKTAAAATTLTANDFILFVTAGSFGFTVVPPTAQIISGSPTYVGINAAYAGQIATGSTITPAFPSSATNLDISTLAIKSNTTTAGNFIGVGAESYIASGTSVAPSVPSNGAAGDTRIAAISELATSAVGITLASNSDIQTRSRQYVATSNNVSVVTAVLTGFKTGDLMTAWAISSTAHPYSSCVSNSIGWTEYLSGNTQSQFTFWYKVAAAGDVGTTLTCTASGNDYLTLALYDLYSVSGGSVSIHAKSTVTSSGSSSTFAPSAVTTSVANTLIVSAAEQFAGVTYTMGAPVIQAATGLFDGFYSQPVAGASATPTWTASASGTWEGGQVALTSTGAVAGPWTAIGSPIAQAGDTELDLYSAPYYPTAFPVTFTFGSAIKASGLIVDFANLNIVPIDVECSAASTGLTNSTFPACTPTARDELFYRFVTGLGDNANQACFPAGVAPIYFGGRPGSEVGAGYSSFTQSGLQTGCGGFTNPFSSVTLGLSSLPALAGGWFAL